MTNRLAQDILSAGVIGAGGAGFPTHVKAQSQVEIVIANGAECEPLIHSDQWLMENKAEQIVAGLRLMMNACNAQKGIVATKKVYTSSINALSSALRPYPDIQLKLLDNTYPSGDEFILVYETTGRIIPESGLPLHVGVVVDNVETLYNVFRASRGMAVVERTVTISGEVASPGVYRFPIGTPIQFAAEVAGGCLVDKVAVIDGGPMMGRVILGTNDVIRKTTSSLIFLWADHPFVQRRTLGVNFEMLRTISMCCQCRECTDLCPRYLLGHNLEPHKVMRAIITRQENPPTQMTQAYICSSCGVCEIVACPLGLSPRNVFAEVKKHLAASKVENVHHHVPESVRDSYRYTRIPKPRALARTGLDRYNSATTYRGTVSRVPYVELLLSQHIGAPSVPVVKEGQVVNKGDIVATAAPGKLSTNLCASISGRVAAVLNDRIIIEGKV